MRESIQESKLAYPAEQRFQGQMRWAALVFLIFVPAIAQLLFSWMGMTPTDDGFFLGMSRRILDGAVPHLDFITARPAGTGILWMPLVLFGGDYTIWISRLIVWFQFACIAWIWTAVIARLQGQSLSLLEQVALALMAFAITAQTFILTPWPTVDGFWITSVGLVFGLSRKPPCKFLGYALIGASCLFKQNFLALGPVFLVVLGDWRRIAYWFALAVLPMAYVAWMWFAGAFNDFVLQITSHTDLYDTGFICYLHSRSVYCGFVAGVFGSLAVSGEAKARTLNLPQNARPWLGSVGAAIAFIPPAICLALNFDSFERCSFVLFGVVGAAIVLLFIRHRDAMFEVVKAGILVVTVMWTVSISIGYNCPALGVGLAAILLAGYLRRLLPSGVAGDRFRRVWLGCLLASTAITLVCFGIGRSEHIYMERPASELRYSLDGILPGGKWIKTNRTTFEYMKDLQEAIKGLGGQEYAIIPDTAIYWVKAPQKNPLPTDWPQTIELGDPRLFNRVVHDLEIRRGQLVILLAKVSGFSLATSPEPIMSANQLYKIVPYVQSHFRKVGETKYFNIYQ